MLSALKKKKKKKKLVFLMRYSRDFKYKLSSAREG